MKLNINMGAWGPGYFEDDTALDFMAELEESGDAPAVMAGVFEAAIMGGYMETDLGNAVIVSACYIDSLTNGTKFSSPGRTEPLEVDTFGERNPGLDLAFLAPIAVDALKKVMGPDSELNDLWSENEESYPLWKAGITELVQRLSK